MLYFHAEMMADKLQSVSFAVSPQFEVYVYLSIKLLVRLDKQVAHGPHRSPEKNSSNQLTQSYDYVTFLN